MDIPPEVKDIVPGAVGSALALRWTTGGMITLILYWIGGSVVSYYVTPVIASSFNLTSGWVALVGFSFGLTGMMLASKVVELVQNLDTKQLAQAIIRRIKHWVGGP